MIDGAFDLSTWLMPDVIEQAGGTFAAFVGAGVLIGAMFGAVGYVVTFVSMVMRGGT